MMCRARWSVVRCEVEVVAGPRTGKSTLGRYSGCLMSVFGLNRHRALVTRELVCSLPRPSFWMYRKAQDQLVDLSECLICEDVPFPAVEWLGG